MQTSFHLTVSAAGKMKEGEQQEKMGSCEVTRSHAVTVADDDVNHAKKATTTTATSTGVHEGDNGEEKKKDTVVFASNQNDQVKLTANNLPPVPPTPSHGETRVNMVETRTEQAPVHKGDETTQSKASTDEEAPVTFPQRLMEILTEKSNSNSISWLPHGKGWIITNKKLFAAEVLPKYFTRKAKFTSFTRKLNRWNFTRVTRGPECGAYYHPLFQRDNPNLCNHMSCLHKTSQQLQPMNPIALGIGGMVSSPSSMWGAAGEPNALHYMQYLQTFQQQQQQLQKQLLTETIEDQRSQKQQGSGKEPSKNSPGATHSVPGATQEEGGAGVLLAPLTPADVVKTPTESNNTSVDPMNHAAFMAYQAQCYAMMIAQQQQQQMACAMTTHSPPQSASPSQQCPLPLPPKPRKRQQGTASRQQKQQQQETSISKSSKTTSDMNTVSAVSEASKMESN